MTAYKTAQEFVTHRNRSFHFVSYEGQRADEIRHRDANPAAWFLMGPTKRWRVMEHVLGQDRTELIQQLTDWLDSNVFPAPLPATPMGTPSAGAGRVRLRRQPRVR